VSFPYLSRMTAASAANLWIDAVKRKQIYFPRDPFFRGTEYL
jgi:hypothetical protein